MKPSTNPTQKPEAGASVPGTPLPWYAELSYWPADEEQDGLRVQALRGMTIAITATADLVEEDGFESISVEESQANARYIFTACNAFPHLVKALRDILDDWEGLHDPAAKFRQAEAALALAEVPE